jgi:hypothetical protein
VQCNKALAAARQQVADLQQRVGELEHVGGVASKWAALLAFVDSAEPLHTTEVLMGTPPLSSSPPSPLAGVRRPAVVRYDSAPSLAIDTSAPASQRRPKPGYVPAYTVEQLDAVFGALQMALSRVRVEQVRSSTACRVVQLLLIYARDAPLRHSVALSMGGICSHISAWLASTQIRTAQYLREKKEQELVRMQEEKFCAVCIERDRNTALLPCGHVVMCSVCARSGSISACPVCRTAIAKVIDVYL